MMGVAKRIVRLIAGLPANAVQSYLLHFGAEPSDDPLWIRVAPAIRRYVPNHGLRRSLLRDFLRNLRLQVIVLGEGPLGGIMRDVFETALAERIPLVTVDNYYDSLQPARLKNSWPGIAWWLLLGLPEKARYGRISKTAFLAPPLLPRTRASGSAGSHVTVLGYDPQVTDAGLRLALRLPKGISLRVLSSEESFKAIRSPERFPSSQVSLERLPNDYLLSQWVGSSPFVVCKNGFQQIVESLALGTPAVVLSAMGGVPECLLSPFLRPFVCYFPERDQDWSRLLSTVSVWLSARPSMPWETQLRDISNPIRYSADMLLTVLQHCV